MTWVKISSIITLIVAILFSIAFIGIGLRIDYSIVNFCHDAYRNEEMMEKMVPQSDPPILIECKGDDDYSKCVYEKASYDEYKFMTSCGWMSTAWFVMLFRTVLMVVFPVGILSVAISVIVSDYRKSKGLEPDISKVY